MRARLKDSKKKLTRFSPHIRKRCRFCKNKVDYIDYKDIKTLERFITERGKITSRRMSGNCARHQRRIAEVIRKARFIALLPYTK